MKIGVYSYEGAGMSGKIPLERAMQFGNYGPIYKLSSKPQKARLQKRSLVSLTSPLKEAQQKRSHTKMH